MSAYSVQKNSKRFSTYPSEGNIAASSENPAEIQLSDLLSTIYDARRMILVILLLFLAFGISYIALSQPVYRADVLLQIDEKSRSMGKLAELSMLLHDEAPVSAEFAIIRSRTVLGPVIDKLKLNVIVRPVHIPILGALFTHDNDATEITGSPWFNPQRFARNGESLRVESFSVPVHLKGQTFTLVAEGNNRFRLLDPEQIVLTQGRVGEAIQVALPGDEHISLFVSELKSKPGSHFELIEKTRLAAIDDLRTSLTISELGKQSGMLQLSLDGPDRVNIANVLNEIAATYLRQSVERKSTEAEKTIKFLEEQLPIVKKQLEQTEARLNKFRLEKSSVDLSKETQVTLDKTVAIDSQLIRLRSEREDLIRRFTPEHPRVAALDAQIAALKKESGKVDSIIQKLPGTQQQLMRLTREFEVSSTLYTTLLNSAQELRIVKAGAVGNVRIIDNAVIPNKPAKPNKGLTFSVTTILGIVIAVTIAIFRRYLFSLVEDPGVIENKFGMPVYAVVPYSKKQAALLRSNRDDNMAPAILAYSDATDPCVESLRSLRTALYFSHIKTKNNIISITSPGPGAGKSFLCANLSVVLANAGKKTLIIDADLRKGRIHEIFGIEHTAGLADVIMQATVSAESVQNFVRASPIGNLDVLISGTPVSNPAELLLHENFSLALNLLSRDYDYVIVDSPPVLAVTDAAIIGRLAGTSLLVVRSGYSRMKEIDESIKRMKSAGVNLRGLVFNALQTASSRYGYGYEKYYH